jgi:hypothetical protein
MLLYSHLLLASLCTASLGTMLRYKREVIRATESLFTAKTSIIIVHGGSSGVIRATEFPSMQILLTPRVLHFCA